MAHIVFRMYPTKSHHNSTFQIANLLKERNHTITYVATSELRTFVRAQGFNFYELKEDLFPRLRKKLRWRNDIWSLFNRGNTSERNSFKRKFAIGGFFEDMVKDLSPDLILFDSAYSYFILDMFNSTVAVATVETMFPLDRNFAVPPLCSKYIPRGKDFEKLLIPLLWFMYFVSQFLKNKSSELLGSKVSMTALLKQKATQVGCPSHLIKTDRLFYPRITKYPELLVAPRELDFNRKEVYNQHYIGTGINIYREEGHHDLNYYRKRDELFEKQVVFCAFGNLSSFHNVNCDKFYVRLINAFKELEYNLILSIGSGLDLKAPLPNNVFVFRSVPQIEVLRRSEIMINHGGLNSITECVLVGVPMIVYPLSSSSDQNGNSARIEFHKLGIRGNLRTDTCDDIRARIEEVTSNGIYRANILRFKSKLATNGVDAVSIVESLI